MGASHKRRAGRREGSATVGLKGRSLLLPSSVLPFLEQTHGPDRILHAYVKVVAQAAAAAVPLLGLVLRLTVAGMGTCACDHTRHPLLCLASAVCLHSCTHHPCLPLCPEKHHTLMLHALLHCCVRKTEWEEGARPALLPAQARVSMPLHVCCIPCLNGAYAPTFACLCLPRMGTLAKHTLASAAKHGNSPQTGSLLSPQREPAMLMNGLRLLHHIIHTGSRPRTQALRSCEVQRG